MRKLAAFIVPALTLVTLVSCHDAGGAVAEPETQNESRTHLTSVEFADSLAAGRMPKIDWIGWNIAGRPLDVFPLEVRTEEELQHERVTKGRRLPDGSFIPFSVRVSFKSEYDLDAARSLIIRHLQPSSCPFIPCEMYPAWKDRYQEIADRLGLPYDNPYDEQGRLNEEWRLR